MKKGRLFGHIVTEETREKLRQANLGKKYSAETRKKVSIASTGRKHTQETKDKLRKINLGKKHSEETKKKISDFWKGKPSQMKGKHHTEETKRKLSDFFNGKKVSEEHARKNRLAGLGHKVSLKNRIILSECRKGSKNASWTGGKYVKPYNYRFNKNLKNSIRLRDNYTCQECGYTEEQLGYRLRIHHIDYNKDNNDENNLISLCMSCHTKTNWNREDWIKYYQLKCTAG